MGEYETLEYRDEDLEISVEIFSTRFVIDQ